MHEMQQQVRQLCVASVGVFSNAFCHSPSRRRGVCGFCVCANMHHPNVLLARQYEEEVLAMLRETTAITSSRDSTGVSGGGPGDADGVEGGASGTGTMVAVSVLQRHMAQLADDNAAMQHRFEDTHNARQAAERERDAAQQRCVLQAGCAFILLYGDQWMSCCWCWCRYIRVCRAEELEQRLALLQATARTNEEEVAPHSTGDIGELFVEKYGAWWSS